MFTPRRLDALKGLREETVGALIQHIREAAADGRAVDIGECAFSITQNLLACTLFARDIADLSSELTPGGFKSLVYEMLEIFSEPNLCDFFPALRWIDPQGLWRRNGNALTRLYVILDQLIDEHSRAYEAAAAKGEAKKNEDFLDVLLKLTRDPNSGFTRENIRPLLSDMFIAGSESSATTIEWAVTELLRHPDKMAAAQSELKQAIGACSFVKESDIMHLPYLTAVMMETLRLHTPGPPIAFLPERLIESDVNFDGKHFQYMPFDGGKRICPGIPLASCTVLLVLASLINSFSWVPSNQVVPEELDVKAKFRLVLQKAAPLNAFPSPLKGHAPCGLSLVTTLRHPLRLVTIETC
ncbi:hypothetical protein EJ110_NYTH52225 [Nymphaea thermarum]|nr:hypothetical protein EJ110_NYTH52225 [Nymphaea thermarum]